MQEEPENGLTFWDHLDELRKVLFRVSIAVVGLMAVAFCFKEEVFTIVLAPKSPDFYLYRFFASVANALQMPSLIPESFSVQLISTRLASQFITYMMVSFYAGIILASPYIIYKLFQFIAPALYDNERKYTVKVVGWGYTLFLMGVLLNYSLIFPLTFRFLATFQVSEDVINTITLESYVDTLVMLSLMMGVVFEIPIVSWLTAKLGLLSSKFMKNYRKHAIVVILFIGAIITPTSDVFTLLMVSIPMYVLYEVSIWIVKRVEKDKLQENQSTEIVEQ